jgi:hypothetical protein
MRRFAFFPVTARRRPRALRILYALPWCAVLASACIYNDWHLNPEPPAPVGGEAGAEADGPTTGGAYRVPSGGRDTTGDAGAGGVDDRTGAGGAAGENQSGAAGNFGASDPGGRGPCDLQKDFGEPRPVPFSNSHDRSDGRLTGDEKTIYFHAYEAIWMATWSELNGRFENERVALDESEQDESMPSITDDGLELYYAVTVYYSDGKDFSIHVSRRGGIEEEFQPGELVQDLPEGTDEPFIAPNGNTLYFVVDGQVWSSTKTGGVFANAKPVITHPPDEDFADTFPTVSADEKTLIYGSLRDLDGKRGVWVHVATRQNVDDMFTGETAIPSLVKANTTNRPNWISRDGCRLYFRRPEGTLSTLWMASRPDLR